MESLKGPKAPGSLQPKGGAAGELQPKTTINWENSGGPIFSQPSPPARSATRAVQPEPADSAIDDLIAIELSGGVQGLVAAKFPKSTMQELRVAAALSSAAAAMPDLAPRVNDLIERSRLEAIGYLQALQALPDPPPIDADIRLRERLILVARRLPSSPGASAEAERRTVRGNELFAQRDFKAAEAEFRHAVRAAPWVADLPYNLALAQEHLNYYKAAASNLRLHLLGNPENASEIRAKMYALELERTRNRQAALSEDCAFGDAPAYATIRRAEQEVAAMLQAGEAASAAAYRRADARGNRRAGVLVSVMPTWRIPQESVFSGALLLKNTNEEDYYSEFSMQGSAFRVGLVSGFDNGNDVSYVQDWSVSFVRMPIKSGSYSYRERYTTYGDVFSSTYVGFDRSYLAGGVFDVWVGPDPFGGRVEVGAKLGVGLGVVIGNASVEEYTNFSGSAVSTQPARDHVTGTLLLDLEPGIGVRVAPGLKVRFTYGVNLPVYKGANVTVQYLFGAR